MNNLLLVLKMYVKKCDESVTKYSISNSFEHSIHQRILEKKNSHSFHRNMNIDNNH